MIQSKILFSLKVKIPFLLSMQIYVPLFIGLINNVHKYYAFVITRVCVQLTLNLSFFKEEIQTRCFKNEFKKSDFMGLEKGISIRALAEDCHPHGHSQLSITTVAGDPIPSAQLQGIEYALGAQTYT